VNGKCPMCGATVRLKSTAKKGDIIYCQACDAELEIVNTSPVELDWPLEDYVDEFEFEMNDYDSGYDDEDDDY